MAATLVHITHSSYGMFSKLRMKLKVLLYKQHFVWLWAPEKYLVSCSSFSSSLYDPGPLHKISSQSVHNFLSNVNKQTNKQTDKHTNATKNITSFAKCWALVVKDYQTHTKKKKSFGQLPAPRSGYATTIMVFFCSFTHLRIPRSPQKFNQFFIVLPRTPP